MIRVLLLLCCCLATAQAVILSGGTGAGNTTGAGAGDGWNYTGKIDTGSGVYLGSYSGGYWVLTAYHVGVGNFALNGTTYTAMAGSGVQLKNTDGTDTDLLIFRIDTQPAEITQNLALRSTPAGTPNVTMIGGGRNREANITTWYVDQNTTPWTWSTTNTGVHEAAVQGYYWGVNSLKRWGTNSVDGLQTITYNVSSEVVKVTALKTDFDNVAGEAQGASGDSGGGMFALNTNGTATPADDFWELMGVMVSIGSFNSTSGGPSGQPGNTAVYGNNTFAADIFTYRQAILDAVSVPEPKLGWVVASMIGVMFFWTRRKLQDGL